MKKRLLTLSLILLALFSLLILTFFKLQITENEKWEKIAKRQHYFLLKEAPTRGLFYATQKERPGQSESYLPLVAEIEKFHLYIDPESIPLRNKKDMIEFLAPRLGIKDKKTLAEEFHKKSRSRRLKMWLEKSEKDEILEWWRAFAKKSKIPSNALYFASDYQRSYPFGKLLGQVLHTTQSMKDEKTAQAIPTGGLELFFNKELSGTAGKRRLMRSPRNPLETGDVIASPVPGGDVYLTIDPTLQSIAEEELQKGVKKCKAIAGWAVMMDPKNGEILALAQYPFFDPAKYSDYFADPLLSDSTRVKAITDANEPGSVMKPLNVAIALKANLELQKAGKSPLFTVSEKFDTSKGFFKGRSKPITDTHFHHYLNMPLAIQKSSNVYMAQLVERIIAKMGTDWYRNALKGYFALGEKTNIELPGETRGKLPMPGKKHPNGAFEWSLATPYSLAMGYNLQLNTIQILRAHAVLASRGLLVQPHLVRKIVKNGETIFSFSKEPVRVLEEPIANEVVKAMKLTTKPGGTARRGDIWGYTEAGKTSTSHKLEGAHYSENRYIANFVGFAPVDQPAFVLIVTMDEPECKYLPGIGKNHHGGNACAPVFREIGRRSLEYLGIEKDDPHGYPMQDPRYQLEKADTMLEAKRLQEIYETWNKKH
ncbi:MAG: peptidoglycan D,D-transpeptidase FtsI family protein [Parachlamydiaceae bacterium]